MNGWIMVAIPLCPHCGFEVGDDEICRACGALVEEIPVRNVSLARGISEFFAGLKDRGFHGGEIEKAFFGDSESTPFFLDEEIEKLHEDS